MSACQGMLCSNLNQRGFWAVFLGYCKRFGIHSQLLHFITGRQKDYFNCGLDFYRLAVRLGLFGCMTVNIPTHTIFKHNIKYLQQDKSLDIYGYFPLDSSEHSPAMNSNNSCSVIIAVCLYFLNKALSHLSLLDKQKTHQKTVQHS